MAGQARLASHGREGQGGAGRGRERQRMAGMDGFVMVGTHGHGADGETRQARHGRVWSGGVRQVAAKKHACFVEEI